MSHSPLTGLQFASASGPASPASRTSPSLPPSSPPPPPASSVTGASLDEHETASAPADAKNASPANQASRCISRKDTLSRRRRRSGLPHRNSAGSPEWARSPL